MKILYFYHAITRIGGVQRILTEKMNYLAEYYGQDVYLITTSQGNHPFAYPLSSKIKHIDLSIKFYTIYQYSLFRRLYMKWRMDKEFITKMTNVINNISPDIIIPILDLADVVCSIKCPAKKIVESHIAKKFMTMNDKTERSIIPEIYSMWQGNKYLKTIEKNCDLIVSLTRGDAKEWNAKNVVVIPNMIFPYNGKRSQLNNKVALFAGRFVYQKGLDRMLEAWAIVVNKRNDWILKIVGDGVLKKGLTELCRTLGIEKNVIFANFTKNIAEEYANSSLFLLTSRCEGFGLVLAEAMQCGVPCVAFDCPYGPADIIDNEKNGIIVENGNIEEFANAVLKLIDDEELRRSMGQAAIEKAKEYLPEKIMPQWMQLFNKITGQVKT